MSVPQPESAASAATMPAIAPDPTASQRSPATFPQGLTAPRSHLRWLLILPAIGVLATALGFGGFLPAMPGGALTLALLNLGLVFVAVAIAHVNTKQRRENEQTLRAEGERFRQLVETTSDWLWEVDENAVYTYASPRVRDLLGYDPREVLGKTPFDLMSAEEAGRVAALFGPIAARHEAFAGLENTNRHKDGRLVVLETSGVPFFDARGQFRGYRGVDRDITERKRIAERLAQLAHHDSLTGLPNRALFLERLQAAIARTEHRGRHIAVLLLDLDRFKLINDTLGHAAGDRLLQAVAQRLTGALREDDTVARLGGDEFVILLVDVAHRDDVAPVAQKLVDRLAAPLSIDGRELFVTTSLGVSVFPGDGADGPGLMKHADIAMYRAKAKGRNNFQLYAPDMSEATPQRLAIETELRRALEREEFELYYQPRVDLRTGKLVSLEALLRWQRPGAGIVSPAEFIPILEETGLIVPVGEWVLRRACDQARQWHEQHGAGLHISVNLSPRQLRQHGFARRVERVLLESGLAPTFLELELTESMLLEHTSHSIALLEELRGMGLKFALDDFGTGYSSLAYLKRFPISSLKIDRSFVADIETGQDHGAIARAVVAMAHSLGMRAVAEGVETHAQLEFLQRHGCDEGQGYWFSRPQTTAAITACLRAGRCIGNEPTDHAVHPG